MIEIHSFLSSVARINYTYFNRHNIYFFNKKLMGKTVKPRCNIPRCPERNIDESLYIAIRKYSTMQKQIEKDISIITFGDNSAGR